MSLVDDLKVFTHRNNASLKDETIVDNSATVVDDELIKIGNNVIVIDNGLVYPSFKKMVKFMKLDSHCNRYELDEEETYVVIRIEKHMDSDAMICGIQNSIGEQFLIDINGLEKA
jgi:hypothetical protein